LKIREIKANTQTSDSHELERLLGRSGELQEALMSLLSDAAFDASPRAEASLGLCAVAIEHAMSVRVLMSGGLATSAVGMMRLQFEALTRSMWLLYAANEAAISKMLAPLSPESEHIAKSLPSLNEMIEAIGKRVGTHAPAVAHQQLMHFKDVSWHAMNSYVHGGIHPLRRSADGFPVALASNILRNSNGLMTMTGMVLAVLTGDEAVTKPMSRMQADFADCLPELLKP
jgi:hypothetical protein